MESSEMLSIRKCYIYLVCVLLSILYILYFAYFIYCWGSHSLTSFSKFEKLNTDNNDLGLLWELKTTIHNKFDWQFWFGSRARVNSKMEMQKKRNQRQTKAQVVSKDTNNLSYFIKLELPETMFTWLQIQDRITLTTPKAQTLTQAF